MWKREVVTEAPWNRRRCCDKMKVPSDIGHFGSDTVGDEVFYFRLEGHNRVAQGSAHVTKTDLFKKTTLTAAIAVGVIGVDVPTAVAGPYFQTDLVSNIAGLGKITDSELVNPWGFSHSPTSPFWTSNQGKN